MLGQIDTGYVEFQPPGSIGPGAGRNPEAIRMVIVMVGVTKDGWPDLFRSYRTIGVGNDGAETIHKTRRSVFAGFSSIQLELNASPGDRPGRRGRSPASRGIKNEIEPTVI